MDMILYKKLIFIYLLYYIEINIKMDKIYLLSNIYLNYLLVVRLLI